MTTAPDDTTPDSELPPQERWDRVLRTWAEADPSDELHEMMAASTSRLRLVQALASRGHLEYGSMTAGFVETIAAATITKTMHDVLTSIDKREDIDLETKLEIATYLLTMVTLVTAATDTASRVVDRKEVGAPGSFAITIRDILRQKKADVEATSDGGQ